jgi:phosphoglycolate phosphatase
VPDRLVIFDCDGTLADSEASIVEAVRQAFSDHGLASPGRWEIVGNIGLSLPAFMAAVAPNADETVARSVVDSYRRHFRRIREERGADPLFDGLADLLRGLQADGVLLGIATGKSRRGLDNFLDAHALRSAFVTLQTADDAPSKPHPAMVERAMEETGSGPHETTLVGDTTFDMLAAKNAGARAVGVDWGHHDTDRLLEAGAGAVARNVPELAHLLGLGASKG